MENLFINPFEETPITPIKTINNPTVRLDIKICFLVKKSFFLNGASMYFQLNQPKKNDMKLKIKYVITEGELIDESLTNANKG